MSSLLNSNRLRYSFRTLLIAVTIATLLTGWLSWRIRIRYAYLKLCDHALVRLDTQGFNSLASASRAQYEKSASNSHLYHLYVVLFADAQYVIFDEGVSIRDTLEGLNLAQFAGIRGLSLARTDIADSNLKFIEGLRALEELSLAGSAVTDNGLKYLYSLRKLRAVDLSSTHVTQEGVRQLQLALPQCRFSK